MIIEYEGRRYNIPESGTGFTHPEEILHFAANPTLEDAVRGMVKCAGVTWQAALHICFKPVAKHFKVNADELYKLWVKHYGPSYGMPFKLPLV